MQIRTFKTIFPLFSLAFSLGCGLTDDDKEPPVVEYVTLSVTTPDAEGSQPFVMTTASCSNDTDSGFFRGHFTGENGAALTVKIKGFATTPGSYTCTQASDNSEGAVGQKFDGCSVALRLPDAESSVNAYEMYRDDEMTKSFTYAGDCTLTTTYDEPTLTVGVTCSGLVQTELQGAARNPIDESVTATIEMGSGFFCDL